MRINFRHKRIKVLSLFLGTALYACGGGGSSSSNGVTDPVCTLTSDRAIIDSMLDGTPPPVVYAYREMGRARESAMAAVSSPDPVLD